MKKEGKRLEGESFSFPSFFDFELVFFLSFLQQKNCLRTCFLFFLSFR